MAGRSATIQAQRNADSRGAASEARATAQDARNAARQDREETQRRNLRESRAVLEYAQQRNDPVAINAARRGVLAAGGDLAPRGEDAVTADFKPDSYGQDGMVTQRDRQGNVTLTKIDGSGKQMPSVVVPAPGKGRQPMEFASEAEAAAAAAAGKIRKGDRMSVGGVVGRWE